MRRFYVLFTIVSILVSGACLCAGCEAEKKSGRTRARFVAEPLKEQPAPAEHAARDESIRDKDEEGTSTVHAPSTPSPEPVAEKKRFGIKGPEENEETRPARPPTPAAASSTVDDLLSGAAAGKTARPSRSPAPTMNKRSPAVRGTARGGGGVGHGTIGLGKIGTLGRGAGGGANYGFGGVAGPIPGRYRTDFHTEGYDHIEEGGFRRAADTPLSTFSIDVDTASYANVRRFLNNGTLPPKGAVRIEEMINYFSYNYDPPGDGKPFSTRVEIAACPWNTEHKLVRVGLKGKIVEAKERKPVNLVFLIDVSGSMQPANKLPLVKKALRLAAGQLRPSDRVALAVYAGASGLVLPSTRCGDRQAIVDAIDRLDAGGSTNGGEGIRLAYRIARENFIRGGINRVILATDGDFNVGVTSQSELVDLVKGKAKQGVFLTVLGFGMGNYKDDLLEKLADKGNGNYAYIDRFSEAHKVLSEQMSGTLQTIAKDVKIQVEFNPARVEAYRLIGYENRRLAARDFNDDKKDAGEIGAGHTVTALYQVVPQGKEIGEGQSEVDALKYQSRKTNAQAEQSDELMTVKLRYKQPDGEKSRKLVYTVRDADRAFAEASTDFRFAAAVASFGMLLRDSEHKGSASAEQVVRTARAARGRDAHGYRSEFVKLASMYRDMSQAGGS